METKFNIGDKVFRATFGPQEKWVTCPDCFGQLALKIELGNGEIVAIDCAGCRSGYEPPRGLVRQYEYSVTADQFTVTGISTGREETRYDLNNFGGSYYTADESDLFLSETEALAHGETKKQARADEENRRWMAKTKDHRTWAWHVHYHRNCAKNAKAEMERHLAKLDIAKLKAKEPS